MRRLFFAFCALSALLSSCSGKGGLTYEIIGSVSDNSLNGKMLYLLDYQIASVPAIDSTVVKDGKFEFKGSVEKPTVFFIRHDGNNAVVITESEPVTVEFGQESVISGGELNNGLAELNKTIMSLNNAAYIRFSAAKTTEAKMKVIGDVAIQRRQLYSAVVDKNKGNILGAYAVCSLIDDIVSTSEMVSLEQFDELVGRAEMAADYDRISAIRRIYVNELKTANGEMFIDFSGQTLEGEPSSLSDYVGKGEYVLADFWASWCGPWQTQLPNIKAAYQKYTDKGLVVIGVNVWDTGRKYFEQVVESEELVWPQIYASHDNTATNLYGIRGIPTFILFAPDGTIVDRLKGEDIDAVLTEIYNK
ncbi:MAG: TlpA disulfide reductase family protein [Rikenellaceae bacterium]